MRLLIQRDLMAALQLAIKQNKPTMQYVTQIRRNLPTLATNLKNQFGLISDLVTSVNLGASRGASETVKIRSLREVTNLHRIGYSTYSRDIRLENIERPLTQIIIKCSGRIKTFPASARDVNPLS